LSVLHYFDSLTKLYSDFYLAKFLNTSAKSFFPCEKKKNVNDISEQNTWRRAKSFQQFKCDRAMDRQFTYVLISTFETSYHQKRRSCKIDSYLR